MAGPTDIPSARRPHHDLGGLLELYAEYGAAVYTLALHVTSSPDAAAEITYDVFTHDWAGPHRADRATDATRTRLAAATHGRATRAARRPASRSAEDTPRTAAEPDTRQLARSLALAARMGGTAANLDPQQRLALALTYSAGCTIGDTARILGLSRSTVFGQLAAGLRLAAEDRVPGPEVVGTAVLRVARRTPARTAIAAMRSAFRPRARPAAPRSARHRHVSPPPAAG